MLVKDEAKTPAEIIQFAQFGSKQDVGNSAQSSGAYRAEGGPRYSSQHSQKRRQATSGTHDRVDGFLVAHPLAMKEN